MRITLTLVCLLLFPLFALAQNADIPPTPTVTPTPSPTPTPFVTPAGQQTIQIGDTVAASFPAGTTSATYYFEGNAGQYVSVALEIPLPYTKVSLLDDLGNELARGDFMAGRGMEIPAVRLPKDGLYTLTIERSEGLDTFMLKLNNLVVEDIAYGQVIDGELAADETAKLYRFAGARFDVIDVSLRSTAFDAYVVLLNEAGEKRTSDDNSGGVRDAFLGLQYLFETGDFLIYVSSKDGRSSGAFQLRLNKAVFQQLEIGDSVDVTFTADAPVAYFEFEGSIGDVVSLSVQSGGTIDTLLQTADPEYMPWYEDDDSGAGFDPEIFAWLLGKDGTYRILLRPYLIGSEGQVTLTLAQVELPSLDSGTQQITLTQKRPIALASFQGNAGEQVRLMVAVDPLMDNPPQVEVIQNGQSLASSDGGRPTFTLDVTIPAYGLVMLQLIDVQSGPGTVQLSLERLTP